MPFVGDDVAADLLKHIQNKEIHVTSEEKAF
jgi:hypothetical protein